MRPDAGLASGEFNITQEEIQECLSRWKKVKDSYNRNLEMGTSYEETGLMLYQGNLSLEV